MHSRPLNPLLQSMPQLVNAQVDPQSCTMQLLHIHLPKARSTQQYQLLYFASKVVDNQINTKSRLNRVINIV